jgi:acetyl esterase/lipase
MSNGIMDRFTQLMRDVRGTKAEPVRNVMLWAAGRCMDGYYYVKNGRECKGALHPLSRVITSQVGDPFQRWDLSNIPAFRVQFEEMLDYLPKVVHSDVRDDRLLSRDGDLMVRRFSPGHVRRDLCVIFLHGGGFVIGNFGSNDPECDEIAMRTSCEVMSVNYPLSPESKFPSALEKLREALLQDELLRGRNLAFVGESAGANLALSLVQQEPRIRSRCAGLVLAYPFLDLTLSGDTVKEFATGYFLTRDLLQLFVDSYTDEHTDPEDPRVSPLFGDMTNLPDILTIVGEFDPLRSDATRLSERNSNARLEVFCGMLHGFLQLRTVCSARREALDHAVDFINALSIDPPSTT